MNQEEKTDTREDGEPAHAWISGQEAGFKPGDRLYSYSMCKSCGVLKGPDKFPETPCRGKVKVTLR